MNNDLVAFSEISSVFEDLSNEFKDYIRDPASLVMNIGDKLYLGLYKPFNSAYVEFATPSAEVSVTFRYSDGSSFQPLSVTDDSKGFSRSGFIKWERNIEDWAEQSVNGQSLYWIEIEFNEAVSFEIQGFNIVFSSDYDIEIKNPFAMDYLPKNDSSFIRYHVACRDEIVQLLRNGGYVKMPSGSDDLFFQGINSKKDLNKWDLLDIEQVKEAATFRALSLIFFNESRNVEDKEYNLYRQYQGKFGQSFKLFYISLDTDDDGIEDNNEKLANNEITVVYE